MGLREVVSMFLEVGSVIWLGVDDLLDFRVFDHLRFERGSSRFKLAVILLRLGHEDVFEFLFDVFAEEHSLTVCQRRRFRSLVELSRYYYLLVMGNAAPSWQYKARRNFLKSFPCFSKVHRSSPLALQCFDESEEVADERIRVGLFESFTFLLHS